MSHRRTPRSGFTLIELSVVLVILGLLVGGVLVGRDLIEAATVRAQVSQLAQLDTAVTTFQVKYDCLPGDCADAVRYGLGTAGGPGDDGDGKIYADGHMTQGYGLFMKETLNAGYHLMKAGLIADRVAGHDFGVTPFDGLFTGRTVAAKVNPTTCISPLTVDGGLLPGNLYFLSRCATPDNPAFEASMTASDALALDTKMDDGRPVTGSVVTFSPYSGPYPNTDWSGCTAPGPDGDAYDAAGAWKAYGEQVRNTPPDPAQLGCGLAVRAAW